jgi:predicted nucleotidyltransferase
MGPLPRRSLRPTTGLMHNAVVASEMIRGKHAPAKSMRAVITREVAGLGDRERADLARVVTTLVDAFAPERVYLYGSQARGTAGRDSDVDLLLVVPETGEFPHHLDQAAYRAVGDHLVPLDIMFMSQEEFAWQVEVAASLPATVLREGRLLYAAPAA